jgi:hypothetical protein
MKAILNYWNSRRETIRTKSGYLYETMKSVITKEVEIHGSEEEIFRQFDKLNNSLKYCNGSYYEFKDESLQSKYMTWYKSLSKTEQMNLYYGNGVVD